MRHGAWLLGGIAATGLGAVAYQRWSATGPTSFAAEYERLATAELALGHRPGQVTEVDLAPLPPPVARFLRATGAVGAPRISNFRATIHGRIRSDVGQRWMPFTGEQVNRYGPVPSRLFHITARMRGAPVDVLHSFIGEAATMRVRALSIVPIVDARGQEMNRSETVTIFNDMCVLAPAALVDADIAWEPVDDRTARGDYTRLGQVVGATLYFDDQDRLIDFVSDDRFRSSGDGSEFTSQRWSTPLCGYRPVRGRTVCTIGTANWHPDPDGPGTTYLDFRLDDIEYNVGPDAVSRRRAGRPRRPASRSGR
jgi:hypothetical protein